MAFSMAGRDELTANSFRAPKPLPTLIPSDFAQKRVSSCRGLLTRLVLLIARGADPLCLFWCGRVILQQVCMIALFVQDSVWTHTKVACVAYQRSPGSTTTAVYSE